MSRGDIHWCEFAAPDRRRPVVILTRDSLVASVGGVTVAPITTKLRGLSSRVRVGVKEGLAFESEVNLMSIATVEKSRIGGWIGKISSEGMESVCAALAYSVGCSFDR